ncbi:far upstream element-binding 2-like [Olea europaea subsp. europaea]|uniref:Far upstream element-binding 2-like n=1 Tax=Olea europaea subsp. europaea TaxID=158383 RepID=A0A8S0RIX3_OLEEU|nr:far upstream element-binding 2-like [Olea europaea subsp. europaea]
MADEVPYASGGVESNKRKYEDSQTPPPPVPRRPTGFSSTPDVAVPLPSYNSVPPPMNEIEMAKQKAQEIAARLLNNADATKRVRVENGAGGGGYDSNDGGTGFSSAPFPPTGQKPLGLGLGGPPQGASYGYPGPTKKIEIPNGRVGVIIGKGGETIKYLQLQSGAKIQVTRDMDADPNSSTRGVELTGTPDQIAKAEQLINDVLAEAEAGGSGTVARRFTGQPSGAEQFVMKIPNNKVGLVIGKGGETIKNMQASSGARIQVIPLHLPPGDTSLERTVQIDGSSEQVEAAKQLVNEVTSEIFFAFTLYLQYAHMNFELLFSLCFFASSSFFGSHLVVSNLGIILLCKFSLNFILLHLSSLIRSLYSSCVSLLPEQTSQVGSYDYYSQQPPAYSQGQGYSQDGYGGYNATAPQPSYGQPQPNPVQGYDQQQQGYNSTYGNVLNPTSDGQPPAYGTTGDATQAPASGQAGYGVPPTSQGAYGTQPPAGYGPPQGQKLPSSQPAYGQPQQSPSAQGGYSQPPVQPSYAHSQPPPTQPGYPQTDSGTQRPSSGYLTSQPGYGPPPYGAPPTQTGYGGQQQPPLHNTAYGGGYSQPPVYSADGSAGGGGARGTYDAAPAQTVQPSGSAKASPPS